MRIFLNKNEINKELVTVSSGLNYGRFYNKKTEEYIIRLNKDELIELIEDKYIIVRDEIKLDDVSFNDNSDFKDSGYCSLNELFNQPKELESIIQTYLDKELFQKLFSDSLENLYIINSTDSIKVCSDEIIITGRVFKKL